MALSVSREITSEDASEVRVQDAETLRPQIVKHANVVTQDKEIMMMQLRDLVLFQ